MILDGEIKFLTTKKFNHSEIHPSEWYSINRFILELDSKNSPYVSMYFPHDKKSETIQLLRETKRSAKAEKIESSIEKRILKLNIEPKKEFINTYCIFGWEENENIVIKNIAISKKLPYVYVVGKKPYLKPFNDILKANYHTIVVVLDHKSVPKFVIFKADKILSEEKSSINLQGRHKKGGQSQKRFLRARQTFIQGFFKRIVKKINAILIQIMLRFYF